MHIHLCYTHKNIDDIHCFCWHIKIKFTQSQKIVGSWTHRKSEKKAFPPEISAWKLLNLSEIFSCELWPFLLEFVWKLWENCEFIGDFCGLFSPKDSVGDCFSSVVVAIGLGLQFFSSEYCLCAYVFACVFVWAKFFHQHSPNMHRRISPNFTYVRTKTRIIQQQNPKKKRHVENWFMHRFLSLSIADKFLCQIHDILIEFHLLAFRWFVDFDWFLCFLRKMASNWLGQIGHHLRCCAEHFVGDGDCWICGVCCEFCWLLGCTTWKYVFAEILFDVFAAGVSNGNGCGNRWFRVSTQYEHIFRRFAHRKGDSFVSRRSGYAEFHRLRTARVQMLRSEQCWLHGLG